MSNKGNNKGWQGCIYKKGPTFAHVAFLRSSTPCISFSISGLFFRLARISCWIRHCSSLAASFLASQSRGKSVRLKDIRWKPKIGVQRNAIAMTRNVWINVMVGWGKRRLLWRAIVLLCCEGNVHKTSTEVHHKLWAKKWEKKNIRNFRNYTSFWYARKNKRELRNNDDDKKKVSSCDVCLFSISTGWFEHQWSCGDQRIVWKSRSLIT